MNAPVPRRGTGAERHNLDVPAALKQTAADPVETAETLDKPGLGAVF
jgi:hypothetical protein